VNPAASALTTAWPAAPVRWKNSSFLRRKSLAESQAVYDATGIHVQQIKRYEAGSSLLTTDALKNWPSLCKSLRIFCCSRLTNAAPMTACTISSEQFRACQRKNKTGTQPARCGDRETPGRWSHCPRGNTGNEGAGVNEEAWANGARTPKAR